MSLSLDPQVAEGLALILALVGDAKPPPVGDWKARRANLEALLGHLASLRPPVTDVEVAVHPVTAIDGVELEARWYVPSDRDTAAGPTSAVLYLHGGGMILGSIELYDAIVRSYVSATRVPMLAVEYRLAPEYPHPTPVEDCYQGLAWLAGHAGELGVDPARIAVMGDSAGGGLAAGVALIARDRGGPVLAQQILIYPMLDDRSITVDPQIAPYLTWTYDDNITGWDALLGASHDGVEGLEYAAPARAASLAGLAPAFIDVGDLDLLRDEDVAYARRLAADGVPCELHVYPGGPHGFEGFAPLAELSQRAVEARLRIVRAL
jgi:acetyl esterase/lipase